MQYIATLFTRPLAGRYADLWGPKRVATLGMLACAGSGACYSLAFWAGDVPWLSLSLLIVGRLLLGLGESFGSSGPMLWGMSSVGTQHTARVISWNGVATYGAMALGAPLGVWLAGHWQLPGLSILIVTSSLIGILGAIRKSGCSIATGQRMGFHRSLTKSGPIAWVWPWALLVLV